tara:strand:+ start:165 stop:521 length:357 start_codon:yes stop_codon:yes gene_type:complete
MTIAIIEQRIEILEKQVAILIKNKMEEDAKEVKKEEVKEVKEEEVEEVKEVKEVKKQVKKRGPSGYNLFCKANRDAVKEKFSDENIDKPKNTDILKELAAMWKMLEQDEKNFWNSKTN